MLFLRSPPPSPIGSVLEQTNHSGPGEGRSRGREVFVAAASYLCRILAIMSLPIGLIAGVYCGSLIGSDLMIVCVAGLFEAPKRLHPLDHPWRPLSHFIHTWTWRRWGGVPCRPCWQPPICSIWRAAETMAAKGGGGWFSGPDRHGCDRSLKSWIYNGGLTAENRGDLADASSLCVFGWVMVRRHNGWWDHGLINNA